MRCSKFCNAFRLGAFGVICLMLLPMQAASRGANLVLAADDFEFQGDWFSQSTNERIALTAPPHPVFPPATAVDVPKAGKWRLWVCTRDYPDDRPGTRTFAVKVGNVRSTGVFGAKGNADFAWEEGGSFDLPAGPVLLTINDSKAYARLQGLVLSNDPKFTPTKPAGSGQMRSTPTVRITPTIPDASLTPTASAPLATLANDRVQFEFVPATREAPDAQALSTVMLRAKVRSGDAWIDAETDAWAEGYFAVVADSAAKLTFGGFHPYWKTDPDLKPVTVEAGGASVQTITARTTGSLAQAGVVHRFLPLSATRDGNSVRIEFRPSPAGTLQAVWSLAPGAPAASVTMTFVPAVKGQVALGYEAPFRKPVSQVGEVLLPMMYHRHRLPDRPTTLLSNVTPTPVALVQTAGTAPQTIAVMGDPADLGFVWPNGKTAPFALSIGDTVTGVQPAIWGPVVGSTAAESVGKASSLRFLVMAGAGDWYAGFRTVTDQVFALRDYRQNVRTSLSDAALNMIDLVMDDAHGGWWDRASAWYQIESKDGSSHASPMTLLSLYRLTGNGDVYTRRALPTMQFMLSRDGPHFSPVPGEGSRYPDGSMNGPSRLFGTSTYAGLWELTGRQTGAFADIALPKDDVRATVGYSHAQPFDEWLSRYLVTNDKADLAKACELADKYVQQQIVTPPSRDLGPQPFFYISFVPDWEGLLRLYEVTQSKRYLDAAAFGARQLMTGVWTQPVIPQGEVTIHAGGLPPIAHEHTWWKGPSQYREGWPPAPGTIAEHKVPAWQVSNVGLSFEQPITFNPSGVGRQIWECAWAPHFLRLAKYTGDKAFETYARNSTVGRWGSYPGYYAMGQTDLPQDPRYPYTGPDVTDFYYHHIPAHLAWTIDYLVTEAETLSGGKIAFPSLRQHGYAYFDSRIFGHAPGKVFDDSDAWLLFRRGLVAVENVQFNTLLAHGPAGLDVILTNQSQTEQTSTVTLSPDGLKFDASQPLVAKLRVGAGEAKPVTLTDGRLSVAVPPRGLAVLSVPSIHLEVPAHRLTPAAASRESVVTVEGDVPATKAAALRRDDGPWHAYIWSGASTGAKNATLHYLLGKDDWKETTKTAYPFEFTIPVADPKGVVRFRLDLTRADGTPISGHEGHVGGEP